jgi:hypothetical protein
MDKTKQTKVIGNHPDMSIDTRNLAALPHPCLHLCKMNVISRTKSIMKLISVPCPVIKLPKQLRVRIDLGARQHHAQH